MSVWTKLKSTVLSKTPTKPQLKALLQPKPITGHTPLTFRSFLYSLSLRHLVLISLPILSLLGLYGTWALGFSNGLFSSIISLLEDPEASLPGTDELLLRSYTGLGWVDNQLAVLVTFFAPVLDAGTGREALLLFSLYGLGQFGGVWTLMVMESLRVGNRGLAVSFIGTIGLIFQNISYTITTPLWLMLHLLTSPVSKPFPGTHANGVLLIQPWDLRILPFSITISYLLPSILMGLPSPAFFSTQTHQRWIALWQAFPLWTVLTHYLLRTTIQWISNRIYKVDPKARTPAPQGASYLNNAKWVYQFVIGLCMATHLLVLLITTLPSWLFPSFSPLLTRLGKETLSSVYVPYFPSLSHELSSFAEGVHTFLIWDLYIGSTAFVLWAVLLYRNATTEKTIVDPTNSLPVYRELLTGEKPKKNGGNKATRKLVLKIAGWCLASGPIGALAVLLWERDAIVRQKIKQGI
ncbi:uncharacterized protein LY89DRAFT_687812 [Mollisia scopiformis]|uniref:Uncharacterized protein n=1 Tax=Mollisia scopiformis TaxID=149040 RepID=A0A194WY70_MOLSC|nr:uncharacterized protein LY89DRAFT_687812 [Mollisia scopiformis]KUJ12875.1 hypothetical protein LY89DRAFT_687812 [Mollisia scopiformis]